jgi:hypothetical protein
MASFSTDPLTSVTPCKKRWSSIMSIERPMKLVVFAANGATGKCLRRSHLRRRDARDRRLQDAMIDLKKIEESVRRLSLSRVSAGAE